jgi:hypothetical protein
MSDATQRAEYVAALRAFADWLDANPDVETPGYQRLLLALTTNEAVEEFAQAHGLDVAYDDEGNASADLAFGPIVYHVYGYVDFAAHCERNAERDARAWASKKGMVIQPAEGGDAR